MFPVSQINPNPHLRLTITLPCSKAHLRHGGSLCFQSALFFFLRFFWCGPFLKSLLNLLQYCFCFMLWFFGHKACGILAPRPGIKPVPPPAVEAQSLNHWATREVPQISYLYVCSFLSGIWTFTGEIKRFSFRVQKSLENNCGRDLNSLLTSCLVCPFGILLFFRMRHTESGIKTPGSF